MKAPVRALTVALAALLLMPLLLLPLAGCAGRAGRVAAPAVNVAPAVADAPAGDAPAGDAPAAADTPSADAPPAAAPPAAPHPHLLRDLTPDGPYPRFTPAELAACGYPDHMHAFFWPDWSPPVDQQGRPYGPGSSCRGGRPAPGSGMEGREGLLALGPFTLETPAAYTPCEVAFFAEICDWARVRCRDLLGLRPAGRLHIISPPDLDAYRQRTGFGAWRLHALAGDTCVIQPLATLLARTLAGHAAVELTTLWALDQTTGQALPPWLRWGLALYLGDAGIHLNNFVARHRAAGIVPYAPARADAILSAPPAADPEVDQQDFRLAMHAAFLMVWRLVEDEGGLAPLRDLLAGAAGGESFAAACRRVYGVTPEALAARLDPAARGEPVPGLLRPQDPHLPPPAQGDER